MLEIRDITLKLNHQSLFEALSFKVKQGEILGILAPSGTGKTSLLRALAGFQKIDAGQIYLDNTLLAHANFNMMPQQRQVGMVFQDFALFPHMTVAENLAFGLAHLTAAARQQRITEMLNLTHLADFSNRYPHQLSGGQQQRAALARALAPKPTLLLMDEAFSNLDTELRCQLLTETRQLLKHEGVTAILVTHDLEDAQTLCDSYAQLHAHGLSYLQKRQAA